MSEKMPQAGDLVRVKGEDGTFLVIEWNIDRGIVAPTDWPYAIVPQEMVRQTDIEAVVRGGGRNPHRRMRCRSRNIGLASPTIAGGPYELTLEAWGNPDHGQDPDRLFAPRKKVTVHALDEGSKIVEEYRDENGLGGGNWGGAAGQLVTKDGRAYVGRYSYNARFWPWNNRDGHGLPGELSMPEGLSEGGRKAFWIIVAILARTGMIFTGGYQAFRQPDQWHRSGHASGGESELVIVHDGGDLGFIFGQYGEPYSEIQEALRKADLFVEGINAAVSAVYAEKSTLSRERDSL